MRLLLDEMYPQRLAKSLRDAGHEVVAVLERVDLRARPDADVARWARDHGHVVVTENVADFTALARDEPVGLLFVNGRRWPRSPGGLARLEVALDQRLRGRSAGEVETVDWL